MMPQLALRSLAGKHDARPFGAVPAGHDFDAVHGDGRHVGHLVGEDASVHDAHRYEPEHHEPERRAAAQFLPADGLKRTLVLGGFLDFAFRIDLDVVGAALHAGVAIAWLEQQAR